MIIRSICSLTVLLGCLFSLPLKGQDQTEKGTLQLDSLGSLKAQQLIYLQLSKGVFETGEDIWFKAYHMDSRFFQPSIQDTTMYIQLRQEHSRKLIAQEKFLIKNGFSDGHIRISDTIPPGNYMLLAFSRNSMLSDTSEHKALRTLKIMKRIQSPLKVEVSTDRTGVNPLEEIIVTIRAIMEKHPVKDAKVSADQYVAGKFVGQLTANTGANGEASLKLNSKEAGENMSLDIQTTYLGETVNYQLMLPIGKTETISVDFFPEGGHLVAGLNNEIAFMSRQGGRPKEVAVQILENGKPIAKLKSLHDGMGKFSLTPKTGAQYTVKLDGQDSLYRLPRIEESGTVLNMIGQTDKNISFQLTRNDTSSARQLFISAQVRGMTVAVYKAQFAKDSLSFNLPKEKLPQGIIEITIYNADTIPILERLVYLDHGEKISINANLAQPAYKKKDKVVLNIIAKNEKGEPIIGHFGISVIDARYQNILDRSNISTHTLLSSQIKGSVINPEYYFDEANKDRAFCLDLLLMTQGWRKYRWGRNDLLTSNVGDKFIDNHTQGKITSKSRIPKALLTFTPEKYDFLNLIEVDGNGTFHISKEQMSLSSQGYIYIKPIGDEEVTKNAAISISDSFANISKELGGKKLISPAFLDLQKVDTLSSLPKLPGVVSLEQVNIKTKAIQSRTYGDKYIAKLDSIARFSGNFDFVGKCGWLNCGSCGSGTKPVEGVSYSRFKDGRVPMHGSFSSTDVLRTPYEYPTYTDEQLLKLFNIHRVQSFAKGKVFYSPDYEQFPEDKNVDDYRNTLTWNPSVITNEKGEASITFYCSDITGGFIANLEGIDGTGRLGQSKLLFVVKENK